MIRFSDGTNTYDSNPIMIEGRQRVSLFLYATDLSSEIGFDAIIQAV
jgi:hypothetical protein